MPAVIRPLLAALTLTLLTGCLGTDPVATLDQRPTGLVDEVLTWTVDAVSDGPRHTLAVGIDVDEAQLMGWARTDRPYGTLLYVTLTGPGDVRERAMIRMPVTEQRQIGEDKDANTVQVAYLAAGDVLPSGFRRVPAEHAFTFVPAPGRWELTAKLAVPPAGEKKALKGIRAVRMELTSRAGKKGLLSQWTEEAPQLPVKKVFPLTVP